MSSLGPVRFSLAALLLSQICYGQEPLPFSESPSTTTSTDDPIFSILDSPTVVAAPGQPFAYPPGNYTIDNTIFTVACEEPNSSDGLSPYTITQIANSISDYGECMALCNQLGSKCTIALWDFNQENHCVLLTALANDSNAVGSRCYAAKGPSGSLGPSVSSAVSSVSPSAPASSRGPSSSPYYPSSSESFTPSGFPSSPDVSFTSRPYPPGPRPSNSRLRPPPSDLSSLPFIQSSTSTSTSSSSSSSSSSTSSSSSSSSSSTSEEAAPTATRDNAYCGTGHGSIPFEVCPQDDPVWGRCCSRFGFCGGSAAYCGDGCQDEFGSCGGDFNPSSVTDFPFSTVFLPRSVESLC